MRLTIPCMVNKKLAHKSISMPTNFSCGCSLIKSACLTKREKGAGEYIFVLVFISLSETSKKYEGGGGS